MKNLFFLIIIIITCIVGYMYFFGKGEDRERAETVVNETKDLGRSVADFLKRQKDRYDDGEFDRLLDRISKSLKNLKTKPDQDQQVEQDLEELETELKKVDPEKLSEENKEKLRQLLREVDQELKEAR
jgi:hypothetical protein